MLVGHNKAAEWQGQSQITAAYIGARMNAFAFHSPKKMPALKVVLGEQPQAKGIDEEAIKARLRAYQRRLPA